MLLFMRSGTLFDYRAHRKKRLWPGCGRDVDILPRDRECLRSGIVRVTAFTPICRPCRPSLPSLPRCLLSRRRCARQRDSRREINRKRLRGFFFILEEVSVLSVDNPGKFIERPSVFYSIRWQTGERREAAYTSAQPSISLPPPRRAT